MHLSWFILFGIFLRNNFHTESKKVTPDRVVYEAFKGDAYHRITSHIINTTIVKKLGACAYRCTKHGECVSFNFGNRIKGEHDCQILRTDKYNSRLSYKNSPDFHYFYPINRCMDPSPCQNNGLCYPDYENDDYHCVCQHGSEGRSCQIEHAKVFNFPSKTKTDYVLYEHPFVQLEAFTLSMWVQVDTSTTFHAVFTYATTTEDNGLSMEVRSTETRIMINSKIRSFPAVFDGQWHHLCLAWTNTDGRYSMYIDGTAQRPGNMEKGHVIREGAVVLGQEQDSYKGGFDATQSLQGSVTSVNLWDKVLTAGEVAALADRCATAEGNVIRWTDFHDKTIAGNAKLMFLRFCGH